jgi:hypothetical protein
VSRVGGFIPDALDPSLLERLHVGFPGCAIFAAAVADEHELHFLFEGIHAGDVRRGDAAAAENADVRKLVGIGKGDSPRLHATH